MARHERSVSNLWTQLEFTCGSCQEKLELEMAGRQVAYKCAKCGKTHSYYDVEKFVNKITDIIVDDAEEGVITNLTNFQHKLVSRYDAKQHFFRVTTHTNTTMKVSIDYEKNP